MGDGMLKSRVQACSIGTRLLDLIPGSGLHICKGPRKIQGPYGVGMTMLLCMDRLDRGAEV